LIVGKVRTSCARRLAQSRSSEQAARASALSATHALEELRLQNSALVEQNTQLRQENEESTRAVEEVRLQNAALLGQNTQLLQENQESKQECDRVKQELDEKSETLRILEEQLNTVQFNFEATTKIAERYKNNWAESAGEAEEFRILYRYFEGETMQLRRERKTLNDLVVEERAKEMKSSIVQDTLLHAGSAGFGG
jgi:chromosome segregation ATPase